jgi:hypothetical protein
MLAGKSSHMRWLQQTATRLTGEKFKPAIIVSGEDQRFFIMHHLERVTFRRKNPARA